MQLRKPSLTSAITKVEDNVETWLSCLLEPAPFVPTPDRLEQRALAFRLIEKLQHVIKQGETFALSTDPPDWLMEMVDHWTEVAPINRTGG